jgi:hypothetical protein
MTNDLPADPSGPKPKTVAELKEIEAQRKTEVTRPLPTHRSGPAKR